MKHWTHAKELAWTISNAILDSKDDELKNLYLSQLLKIRDIIEEETNEYLNQQIENGKLQIRN